MKNNFPIDISPNEVINVHGSDFLIFKVLLPIPELKKDYLIKYCFYGEEDIIDCRYYEMETGLLTEIKRNIVE